MTQQKDQTIEQTAQMLLDGAKKRGIGDVKIVVKLSRNISTVYRKGLIDKVEESSRKELTLHLYDNNRYSVNASNDFRTMALEQFLDSAVALTRAMEPDPFRELTDPALYRGRERLDLKIVDPDFESLTTQRRNDLAREAEAAAMSAAGDKAISAEAGLETQTATSVQLHSNGFEGYNADTQAWLYTEISLKDSGERRPESWDVIGSRCMHDLSDAAAVGQQAAARAMLQMNPERLQTQKCPMIVENRVAERLLDGLISATRGNMLQQKRSFLENCEDTQIASEVFSLIDNPFVESGFGSRLFDAEGIAAKVFPIVEQGVLKNFYIDTYYGKKLGRRPTTGNRSNLVLAPGGKSLDDLVKDVHDGILVRGFIGGNSNSTTGDFSLGVFGTRITNGRLAEAVSEANISGNHKELWKKLVQVGNDPWIYSKTRIPSLLFDEIQFSGN